MSDNESDNNNKKPKRFNYTLVGQGEDSNTVVAHFSCDDLLCKAIPDREDIASYLQYGLDNSTTAIIRGSLYNVASDISMDQSCQLIGQPSKSQEEEK